jgi:hypothetical protein
MTVKMANDHFKTLINERFNINQIYSQIKSQKRGVLYKVINQLERDEVQAKKVCEYFGIETNSYIKDDFSVIYDNIGKDFLDSVRKSLLIDKIDIFNISSMLEKPVLTELFPKLEEKTQMEFLIFAAFILLSGFAFVKWQSSTSSQPSKILPEELSVVSPNQSVPTAICLIVPASDVFGLTVGKSIINKDEIIRLIDVSSDFLCVSQQEAENLSIDININQTASPDSKLDFYVRIDIPDGQNIIGKETKYVIKRDLLPDVRGKIKKLGLLESISSISSFNRI